LFSAPLYFGVFSILKHPLRNFWWLLVFTHSGEKWGKYIVRSSCKEGKGGISSTFQSPVARICLWRGGGRFSLWLHSQKQSPKQNACGAICSNHCLILITRYWLYFTFPLDCRLMAHQYWSVEGPSVKKNDHSRYKLAIFRKACFWT
jgi:hypothetical protein